MTWSEESRHCTTVDHETHESDDDGIRHVGLTGRARGPAHLSHRLAHTVVTGSTVSTPLALLVHLHLKSIARSTQRVYTNTKRGAKWSKSGLGEKLGP